MNESNNKSPSSLEAYSSIKQQKEQQQKQQQEDNGIKRQKTNKKPLEEQSNALETLKRAYPTLKESYLEKMLVNCDGDAVNAMHRINREQKTNTSASNPSPGPQTIDLMTPLKSYTPFNYTTFNKPPFNPMLFQPAQIQASAGQSNIPFGYRPNFTEFYNTLNLNPYFPFNQAAFHKGFPYPNPASVDSFTHSLDLNSQLMQNSLSTSSVGSVGRVIVGFAFCVSL